MTGDNIVQYSPLDAIRAAEDRPIFVIHSADDATVNIDHSYQLQEAAAEADTHATFWFIENADHVQAPGIYPEEYESRLVEFFSGSLAR